MRKSVGKKHIIELNGKLYDTLTGKIVLPNEKTSLSTPKQQSKKTTPQNIDGIAWRRPNLNQTHQPHQRPVEKSHTLMREAVHKPVSHKLHAVATVIGQKPGPSSDIAKKYSPHVKHPAKQGLIHRFNSISEKTAIRKDTATHHAHNKVTVSTSLSQTAVNASSVMLSPLDQAIAKATSHQQPKIKRSRLHARIANKLHVSPRIISTAAAVLAIVLIAGFFGYQNVPNLKMHLASSRAGLHGTLPAYQPPGFHLNDISYKTGQINVSFRSNSDNRNFTVSQLASSWNSNTLRDKLKSTGQASMPVEVPDKGKTLFIYNDSNVTWVDGGVLYKIEGDSKLNSDQLLHLANSL